MLVDVQTSSVLYIAQLSSGVNGRVFLQDPITKSGVGTNTPDQGNAVLNPLRDTVVIPNLDAPMGGTQNLRGTYVQINEIETPTVSSPTEPSGTDFNYEVRNNDFADVNAYYHTDRFFTMVENLGFTISNYFNNTTFPLKTPRVAREAENLVPEDNIGAYRSFVNNDSARFRNLARRASPV